jgi:hypothetical protein
MNIQNKKAFLLLAVTLMTGTLLKAQTENTRERLIDQLKNGTAPGLLFAPEQPTVANANNNIKNVQQQRESLITQIRKGTAPGMKFQVNNSPATARTITPVSDPKTSVAKQGPLASEMDIPKEPPTTVVRPVLPTQEASAEPAPAGKQ